MKSKSAQSRQMEVLAYHEALLQCGRTLLTPKEIEDYEDWERGGWKFLFPDQEHYRGAEALRGKSR